MNDVAARKKSKGDVVAKTARMLALTLTLTLTLAPTLTLTLTQP
jgi:hypothetical protein